MKYRDTAQMDLLLHEQGKHFFQVLVVQKVKLDEACPNL